MSVTPPRTYADENLDLAYQTGFYDGRKHAEAQCRALADALRYINRVSQNPDDADMAIEDILAASATALAAREEEQ